MIIDYNIKYKDDVTNLLKELQSYIASIDKEGYNVVTEEFAAKYFAKTMEEVNKYQGKIFLYVADNIVVGLIIGLINNEEIDTYDFKAPKRGRISELIVKKGYQNAGIGQKLMLEMERYLKKEDCQDILLGVFAYNENALKFYHKLGYHFRTHEMIKTSI